MSTDAEVARRFAANRHALQSSAWFACCIALLDTLAVCTQLMGLDLVRVRAGFAPAAAVWVIWWWWWQGGGGAWLYRLPGRAVAAPLYRTLLVAAASTGLQLVTGTWLFVPMGAFSWSYALAVLLWAPVTEELAFRVLLLGRMRSRLSGWSRTALALLSGLLFGAYHLVNLHSSPWMHVLLQSIAAFGAGTASSLHVLRHGNPVDCVLVHVVHNAFAWCIDPLLVIRHLAKPVVWVSYGASVLAHWAWFYDNLSPE
jgi:membrane protease YdiL (CAAX protease family)